MCCTVCAQVATLLLGGSMALRGQITAQQLTSFVMYVEFVTSASLSVCDQWVSAPGHARESRLCFDSRHNFKGFQTARTTKFHKTKNVDAQIEKCVLRVMPI
jgi:hypothetical protein